MRPGKRLFVGVRVSVGVANALAACTETLARRARDAEGGPGRAGRGSERGGPAGLDLRWVTPANYHVTLAFLGWAAIETVGPVCDALEAAIQTEGRMTFRTSRLGAFPSLDHASVLWAGIEDGGGLSAVARSVGDAMAGLGFAREARPFHPHVTLARLRSPRALREIVLPMAEQMFGDTRIDSITLFESETKSSGSVYSDVKRIAFKRASTAASRPAKRQTEALERGTPERELDDTQTYDGWLRGQGPTE